MTISAVPSMWAEKNTGGQAKFNASCSHHSFCAVPIPARQTRQPAKPMRM